jgi:hypothetical protein
MYPMKYSQTRTICDSSLQQTPRGNLNKKKLKISSSVLLLRDHATNNASVRTDSIVSISRVVVVALISGIDLAASATSGLKKV